MTVWERASRAVLSLAGAALFATAAFGSPEGEIVDEGVHLEPEESVFQGAWLKAGLPFPFSQGYYRLVVSALSDAYDEDVVARVIVLPSFVPEAAIGLKNKNGTYRIFHSRPETHLWLVYLLGAHRKMLPDAEGEMLESLRESIRDLEKAVPGDYREVRIEKCEKELKPDLGRKIFQLWEKMIRGTRHGPYWAGGRDGTTFHFSAEVEDQYQNDYSIAGQIWSPPEESNTGKLVAIVGAMRDYCEQPGSEQTSRLESAVQELLMRLKMD